MASLIVNFEGQPLPESEESEYVQLENGAHQTGQPVHRSNDQRQTRKYKELL